MSMLWGRGVKREGGFKVRVWLPVLSVVCPSCQCGKKKKKKKRHAGCQILTILNPHCLGDNALQNDWKKIKPKYKIMLFSEFYFTFVNSWISLVFIFSCEGGQTFLDKPSIAATIIGTNGCEQSYIKTWLTMYLIKKLLVLSSSVLKHDWPCTK